ncbi:MAG TPA: tRNA (adenosine(37)-N6)-dimethylallyltransferase MiaA [Candidatus Saccharimonadales bacterium]|nr:tRNA (adenosine(37)-N6)-dimethylallyltransferase MiaA [Candidatus Saccharimonadales bacterium]
MNAPLVVIVGETASGKSALAMEVARACNGEIICADSWTVRREVDIGTAKPTPAEQAEIPHHLLDVAAPDEDYTAAVFKVQALHAIQDITKRGKLPIMVGGTGLYIDGVLYDFGFLKAGDREQRSVLNRLTIPELLDLLHTKGIVLGDVDQRNKRRLIRLLETNGAKPTKGTLRPNTLILGTVITREDLRQRIERRIDTMLSAGLEAEVRQLVMRYGWECEALKGVGYREWREYFDGSQTIEQTRQRIIKSTLDLAKRQRTWFKRNNSIHWLTDRSIAVDLITTFLNT